MLDADAKNVQGRLFSLAIYGKMMNVAIVKYSGESQFRKNPSILP